MRERTMPFYVRVLSVPGASLSQLPGIPEQHGSRMRAEGEIKEGGSSETLKGGGGWRFKKNRLKKASLRSIL